ncbi:MAG: GNAT family N-acetyltransferase [Burkholderiales bacterium]
MNEPHMQQPPIKAFETARLRLRWFVDDDRDGEFMCTLVNDPEWVRFIGPRNVNNAADARAMLRERYIIQYQRLGFGFNAVERQQDGALVGMCGLIQRDYLQHPDIGFAFLREYRGMGFALEAGRAVLDQARDVFGLPRVLAIVTPENARSIHLLTQLGLRYVEDVTTPGENKRLAVYEVELQPRASAQR